MTKTIGGMMTKTKVDADRILKKILKRGPVIHDYRIKGEEITEGTTKKLLSMIIRRAK